MDWFTINKKNGKVLRVKYNEQLKRDVQKNNHQTAGIIPIIPAHSILKVNAYLNGSNSPGLIENNLLSEINSQSLISNIIQKIVEKNQKKLDIDLFNGLEDWNCDVNQDQYYRILSDALEDYAVYFLTLKRANLKEYKFQFDSINFLSSNLTKLKNINNFDGIYLSKSRNNEIERVRQELNDWYNGHEYIICVKNGKNADKWLTIGSLPQSFVQSPNFNDLNIKQLMEIFKDKYNYNNEVGKGLQNTEDLDPQNWKEIDPDEL